MIERALPTFDQVHSLLRLEPETGRLFWRETRPCGVTAGQRAGNIQKSGYRYISVAGVLIRSSHIVWLLDKGEWPPGEVDHEDRVRDHDHPGNLRLATRSQQVRNRAAPNKTGFRGVAQASANCFAARIVQDGKRYQIGCYPTAREAALAYDAEVIARFGKGYPTNSNLGLINAHASP